MLWGLFHFTHKVTIFLGIGGTTALLVSLIFNVSLSPFGFQRGCLLLFGVFVAFLGILVALVPWESEMETSQRKEIKTYTTRIHAKTRPNALATLVASSPVEQNTNSMKMQTKHRTVAGSSRKEELSDTVPGAADTTKEENTSDSPGREDANTGHSETTSRTDDTLFIAGWVFIWVISLFHVLLNSTSFHFSRRMELLMGAFQNLIIILLLSGTMFIIALGLYYTGSLLVCVIVGTRDRRNSQIVAVVTIGLVMVPAIVDIITVLIDFDLSVPQWILLFVEVFVHMCLAGISMKRAQNHLKLKLKQGNNCEDTFWRKALNKMPLQKLKCLRGSITAKIVITVWGIPLIVATIFYQDGFPRACLVCSLLVLLCIQYTPGGSAVPSETPSHSISTPWFSRIHAAPVVQIASGILLYVGVHQGGIEGSNMYQRFAIVWIVIGIFDIVIEVFMSDTRDHLLHNDSLKALNMPISNEFLKVVGCFCLIVLVIIGAQSDLASSHEPFEAIATLRGIPAAEKSLPLCQARWGDEEDGADVLSLAYLAKITYAENSDWIDRTLATWFPSTTDQPEHVWSVSRYPSKDDDFHFIHFSKTKGGKDGKRLDVIAIRGAASAQDWLENGRIWGTSVLSLVVVDWLPYGEHIKSEVMKILIYFGHALDTNTLYTSTVYEHAVSTLEKGNGTLVFVGHALGGGIAKVIAAKLGVQSVAFSGPGTVWISKWLNFGVDDAIYDETNIVPTNDLYSFLDERAGASTKIACTPGFLDCQTLTSTICELRQTCGDVFGRSISENFQSENGDACIREDVVYEEYGDASDDSRDPLTLERVSTTVLTSSYTVSETVLRVQSTIGFKIGKEILIIGLKGGGPGQVGAFTFGRVSAIGRRDSVLQLDRPLERNFSVAGNARVQIMRVPHYRRLNLRSNGVYKPPKWNGAHGGVIVFRTRMLILNGVLDATGAGFRGAVARKEAVGYQGESIRGDIGSGFNSIYGGGGGGAVCMNETFGGSGGMHVWTNDRLRRIPNRVLGNCSLLHHNALGYARCSRDNAAFGSGGGSGFYRPNGTAVATGIGGRGGNGGGIVIIFARDILGGGKILANGDDGESPLTTGTEWASGGGGGAGGTIYITTEMQTIKNIEIQATGGKAGASEFSHDGSIEGMGGAGRVRIGVAGQSSAPVIQTRSNPQPTRDSEGLCNFPQFGSGRDGELVVTDRVVINDATMVTADVAKTAHIIEVENSRGISPGDEIMILQVQGPEHGQFEFLHVKNVSARAIMVYESPSNTYETEKRGRVQVVRVPHYMMVTIEASGSIVAPAWDGKTGGVVAFRAMRRIRSKGTVSASAMGFRGGARNNVTGIGQQGESVMGQGEKLLSNNEGGGGGGSGRNNAEQRGAGGGYGTPGADIPCTGECCTKRKQPLPAEGGQPYGREDLLEMHLGSGGGAGSFDGENPTRNAGGYGGRGGGIVFISSFEIRGGRYESTGENGGIPIHLAKGEPEGGGGGSGGSIFLRSSIITNAAVDARGGDGAAAEAPEISNVGCYSTEYGNGGAGRIRVDAYAVHNFDKNDHSVYQGQPQALFTGEWTP